MVAPIVSAAISLAGLVPTITRWFGKDYDKIGVSENLAEKIVRIAKDITGEGEANRAVAILEKDPILLLRFQQEVMRLDRDMERAYLEDRQDARARDKAFVQAGRNNTRADLMVIAAAFGLMGCLGSLAYFREWLPGEAVGIISTIAGIFGSCLKDAYSFEFGSSRGSKEKDAAVFLSVPKKF